MSQPHRQPEMPTPDSDSTFVVEADGGEGLPFPPLDSLAGEALKGQTLDSYAIDREKLAKVKQAAIRLGRSKADLIREGVELVLEKYRDKLGGLAPEPPSGTQPENGSPSA